MPEDGDQWELLAYTEKVDDNTESGWHIAEVWEQGDGSEHVRQGKYNVLDDKVHG